MTKTFEQLQREYDNQVPDEDIPDEDDFDLEEDFDLDEDYPDDYDDYGDWDWVDYEEDDEE